MKTIKTETREVEVIDDVFCNSCGNSCKSKQIEDFYGLVEVSFETGYYSPVFEDGLKYTFSLCENCIKGLFEKFKIKPQEEDYLIGGVS